MRVQAQRRKESLRRVDEEIVILEDAQKPKVDAEAQQQPGAPGPWVFGVFQRPADEEVDGRAEGDKK